MNFLNHIDYDYLKINAISIPILFMIKSSILYSLYHNINHLTKWNFLYPILAYEMMNLIFDYRAYQLVSRQGKLFFIYHHFGIIFYVLFVLYNFEDSKIVDDLTWGIALFFSSTLFIFIRKVFPYSVVPKILLLSTFSYFRIYCIVPYIRKFINGDYIYKDKVIFSWFYSTLFVLFNLFNFYWIYIFIYRMESKLIKKS